jgi:hypothetical protein
MLKIGEGRKMKLELTRKIAVLLISMLLLSVSAVFSAPQNPHNANAIWVDPSNINLTTANPAHILGYKFNVTVWLNMSTLVSPAVGIDTWSAKVYYNNVYLKALACGYTAGSTSDLFKGIPTTPVTPIIDHSSGFVWHSETCAPSYKAVPCAGSLFWITFNVTKLPAKGETLTALFNIQNVDTAVADNEGNQYPPNDITRYNGNYEFKWEPPQAAGMAVEHDGFFGVPPASTPPPDVWPVYWGPYPPSAVGSGFDAKIYIYDLSAAWELTSATFCLCYNTTVIDVIGGTADITLNTAIWNDANATITVTHGDPDRIDFTVYPKAGVVPSGKVLVATVNFTIMKQEAVPPYPIGYYDSSKLTFCDVALEDHIMSIPTKTPKEGEVRILAIVALPMPWLEVKPKDTVLGPEPSIGKEFDVNVIVVNLDTHWYTVAYQFRLAFDPSLLELVEVTEGPFLQDSRWNLYGTFFASGEDTDGVFGHHVYAGDILFPNATGDYDQTLFPTAPGPNVTDLDPKVDPVLATIRFRALAQNCFGGTNLTCGLDILPFWWPEDCHFGDKDGNYIPTDTAKIVNGTYTMLPINAAGRQIDLFGGAINDFYGPLVGSPYLQFPTPYGGQGPNHWMDIVFPQTFVYLHANVTYNYWPVQSKDVGFEIEGPYEKLPNGTLVPKQTYQIWAKLTATTDSKGVASTSYRMPWPCDNPDSITGIWKVTASVTVADVKIQDTMIFYYERLIYITKVTTDKPSYYHDTFVKVTVEYKTHAVQSYPALFSIVIQDELLVPFGIALQAKTVGGAQFCTWKSFSFTVSIYIPKWAYAGNAIVHTSAFDKDPSEGGEPWVSEYVGPTINIYPY